MVDDIEVKRTRIRAAYPDSQSWQDRVDKMSRPQVLAIYARFVRERKI